MSQICGVRAGLFQFPSVHTKDDPPRSHGASLKGCASRQVSLRPRFLEPSDVQNGKYFNDCVKNSDDPLSETKDIALNALECDSTISSDISVEKHEPFPLSDENSHALTGPIRPSHRDSMVLGFPSSASPVAAVSVVGPALSYDPYCCSITNLNTTQECPVSYVGANDFTAYPRLVETLPSLPCLPHHHSPTCLPPLQPSPSNTMDYHPHLSPLSSQYSASPFQSPTSTNSATISPSSLPPRETIDGADQSPQLCSFPYVSGGVMGIIPPIEPRGDVGGMDEWLEKWPVVMEWGDGGVISLCSWEQTLFAAGGSRSAVLCGYFLLLIALSEAETGGDLDGGGGAASTIITATSVPHTYDEYVHSLQLPPPPSSPHLLPLPSLSSPLISTTSRHLPLPSLSSPHITSPHHHNHSHPPHHHHHNHHHQHHSLHSGVDVSNGGTGRDSSPPSSSSSNGSLASALQHHHLHPHHHDTGVSATSTAAAATAAAAQQQDLFGCGGQM
ncbi:hypothetical protein FHG87_005273 [Trinorchestia longiramus]|nr:hypothetical protein FHG87_005273 [Trinorchestia longiramus]